MAPVVAKSGWTEDFGKYRIMREARPPFIARTRRPSGLRECQIHAVPFRGMFC
jgi:hypothetical protein